jgi:hypothetical protein
MNEGSGRDHRIKGFSIWMAGDEAKPGMEFGETGDFFCNIFGDPVKVEVSTPLYCTSCGHVSSGHDFPGSLRRTATTPKAAIVVVLAIPTFRTSLDMERHRGRSAEWAAGMISVEGYCSACRASF